MLPSSPESRTWLKVDGRHVWHPFTPDPHQGPKKLITRAEGSYLVEESGKRLYDATSSWWCITHGHCHPRLVEAVRRQAGVLDQMLFAPHTHPVALELAQKLSAKLKGGLDRVFFSDNGSTAVEAAIKIVLKFWRLRGEDRTEFVCVDKAYHGDTLGAVALGGIGEYADGFQGAVTKKTITAPYCARCPVGKRYPSCDISCFEGMFGEKTAALVIEPLILGAGGMISYPKEYVERAVVAARKAGAVVIFDEVFTGFGRTGPLFAMDGLEAEPDIVCLSKGLTGGMLPLGATVTNQRIYEVFAGPRERAFLHGHTFTANALGCAVALESLKIFDDEGVLSRNLHLAQSLESVVDNYRKIPAVFDVRHRGMVFAVELTEPGTSTPLSSQTMWGLSEKMWERGVWMRPLGHVLYFVPPYSTTPSELLWALENLKEVLSEIQ